MCFLTTVISFCRNYHHGTGVRIRFVFSTELRNRRVSQKKKKRRAVHTACRLSIIIVVDFRSSEIDSVDKSDDTNKPERSDDRGCYPTANEQTGFSLPRGNRTYFSIQLLDSLYWPNINETIYAIEAHETWF